MDTNEKRKIQLREAKRKQRARLKRKGAVQVNLYLEKKLLDRHQDFLGTDRNNMSTLVNKLLEDCSSNDGKIKLEDEYEDEVGVGVGVGRYLDILLKTLNLASRLNPSVFRSLNDIFQSTVNEQEFASYLNVFINELNHSD